MIITKKQKKIILKSTFPGKSWTAFIVTTVSFLFIPLYTNKEFHSDW